MSDSGSGVPAEQAAIDTYFDGDRALYVEFRAACMAQFEHDLEAGGRALAAQDRVVLRRVAHGLKSVCLMLGEVDPSAQAKRLEDASSVESWDGLAPLWSELAHQVRLRFLSPR